jgi:hypothetical protein
MADNLFERLSKGRPDEKGSPPTEAAPSTTTVSLLESLGRERPLPLPIDERDTPLEQLQKWLRRWRRPTITLRDICWLGPPSNRNKQTALNLAQELVQLGWLIPIVARRHDMMKWKIVPKGQRPTAPTTHPPSPTAAA